MISVSGIPKRLCDGIDASTRNRDLGGNERPIIADGKPIREILSGSY